MADRMKIRLDVADLHKRIDAMGVHPARVAGLHSALDAWAPVLAGLVVEMEPFVEPEPEEKPKRKRSRKAKTEDKD